MIFGFKIALMKRESVTFGNKSDAKERILQLLNEDKSLKEALKFITDSENKMREKKYGGVDLFMGRVRYSANTFEVIGIDYKPENAAGKDHPSVRHLDTTSKEQLIEQIAKIKKLRDQIKNKDPAVNTNGRDEIVLDKLDESEEKLKTHLKKLTSNNSL